MLVHMGQAMLALVALTALRSTFAVAKSSSAQCERAEIQYLSSIADAVKTQLPRLLETLRARDDGLMQVLALLSQRDNALPSVLATEFQSRLDRLENSVQEIQRTLETWQSPAGTPEPKEKSKDPINASLQEEPPTSLQALIKDVNPQSPLTSAVEPTTQGLVVLYREQTTESTVPPPLACRRPFLQVGEDCLFLHDETLTWKDARRLCLDHGGDLHVPEDKYWYHIYGAWRRVSDPHPPLDFLEQERQARGLFSLEIWLGGADEDKNGRATWVTDAEGVAQRGPAYGVKGWCIFIDVLSDGYYKSGATSCSTLLRPLCHQKN